MNGVSVFAANNVVDNVCCRDYARTDTSIAYTHGARTPPQKKKPWQTANHAAKAFSVRF